MHLYRSILAALIAVAIVFAPMAAAWAGGARGTNGVMAHTAPHVVANEETAASGSMDDCASMMKDAAGAHDCACCDKDKACPPQFCMAKCFQFIGLAQQSRPVASLVAAVFRPTTPAHPPDWWDQPQPPPPRT